MARDVDIVIQNGRVYYDCPAEPQKKCDVPAERGEKKNGAWLITTPHGERPTLQPSIKCHTCGWHGFIVKGQLTSVADSKVQL